MSDRIIVDRARCIGAGVCVAEAGATFALDADDKVTVRRPPGDGPDAIGWAARGCPVRAIKLVGEAGELIWPAG